MGFCLIAAMDFGLVVVILQVAIALGLVIFVHELGHFAVAKWCGVKCEKFYLGFDFFGWKLFARRWGETEYGIGIFPLGGYVKMLGQEDNPARLREEIERAKHQDEGAGQPEDMEDKPADAADKPDKAATAEPFDVVAAEKALYDPRSYLSKSVPQRMAIISAGVIMNLIFAFCCAVLAYGIGVRQIECGVGNLIAGESAWQAGFEVGDHITAVNGRPVRAFRELQEAVALGDAEQEAVFTVERPGVAEPLELRTRPDLDRGRPTIGITSPFTTSLLSAESARMAKKVESPTAPASPARQAQPAFQFGDRVVAVNGQPVEHYARIYEMLAAHPDEELTISVERQEVNEGAESVAFKRMDIRVPTHPVRTLGLVMTMGEITAVRDGSPAAVAGIRPGDRIVAVDRQPPGDPMTLPERLRKRAGETVTLTLERKDEASRDVQVVLGPVSGAAASPSTDSPLDVPAIGAAYQVHPTVAEVVPNSPAAKAGLRAGDTIQKAVITPPENLTPEQQRVGQPMVTVEFELKQGEWPLLFRWLQRWLQGEQEPPALKPAWPVFFHLLQESLPGSTVTLTTGNGGDIVLEPIMADGRYLADRGLLFEPPYCHYKARSFGEALSLGGKETAASAGQVYLFLRRIGTQISFRQLGGPITIARAAGHYAYQGFPQFLIFMTLLSANLAVINFLPIPVLDGGHMIFLAYEGIRRKPADERIQIALTYIGLLFILTLMIWVIGLDIGLFARN